MSKSIDIDRAAACVRNIVDINRCGTCDKLENLRHRRISGHIVCEDCAAKKEDCLTYPPVPNTSNIFVSDESLTQKADNALTLLNTFEDSFKTDVYRRQRISEQLKIEKEIFPECIQAPVKYFNKRKSLNSSVTNKENRRISFYFGEQVSSSRAGKMEKSKYIQNWLDDNDTNKTHSPRRPFSNINVNDQNFSRVKNKNNVTLTKVTKVKNTETVSKRTRNKANKIKKSVSRNKSGFLINKYLQSTEQENICQKTDSLKSNINKKKNSLFNSINYNGQDESGIVIDDDCIVLDNTQTTFIDKDALALQAVIEADQKDSSDYASFIVDRQSIPENNLDFMKVPYYHKSPLYKTCRDCSGELTKINSTQPSKNVTITIVYNMTDNKENTKQSASVQTELCEVEKTGIHSNFISSLDTLEKNAHNKISDKNDKLHSQGIFSDILKNCDADEKPSKKSIIIDESDSELEQESLHVTAQVHRSCEAEDYGVLSDLPLADLNERKRPSARGTTPDSTNSSDKENFDPNRIKRLKCDKKHSKKDKFDYKI